MNPELVATNTDGKKQRRGRVPLDEKLGRIEDQISKHEEAIDELKEKAAALRAEGERRIQQLKNEIGLA